MNGKNILAVLAGTVANYLLGWIIYGLILMDYLQSTTIEYEGLMNEGTGMLVGYAIASFFFALLATYVINKTRPASAGQAMITVGTIALLFVASLNTIFHFGLNLHTGAHLIVDLVAYTVMSGLTGWVVGMVLLRGQAQNAG